MPPKTTTRIKPVPPLIIKDLHQADQALMELAGLIQEMDKIKLGADKSINAVKARAAARIKPLSDRFATIEKSLTAFGVYNKEALFNKPRSQELVFGVIGFQASSEIAPASKVTWAMVLGNLEALQTDTTQLEDSEKTIGDLAKEAIKIKKEPSREELGKWPDNLLALAGVQRVRKDTFYFKIKQETLPL